MFKKIIFLYSNFFFDKDFERFGCNYFIKKKINFEVWNILSLVDKKSSIKFSKKIKETNKIKIINFNKEIDLINELKKINVKNSIVITNLELNYFNKWIFKILFERSIYWGIFFGNPYPIGKISMLNKFKIILSNTKIIKLKIYSNIDKIKRYIFRQKTDYSKNFSPYFVICSGKLGEKKINFSMYNNCKKIKTHAFAYDDFIKMNNKNDEAKLKLTKSKYIVYIDEDVPNHSDPFYHGFDKKLCDPIIFYNELNRYFDYIEKKTGYKIIIAAYPKSNYEKNNPFNRQILYNKTIELIKDSQFVLQHNSTAVNYSIIFKKPIIFLNSKNYSLHYNLSIKHLADELDLLPINLSNPKKWDIHESVNNKIFDKYFINYISDNFKNRNLTSSEIIYEEIFK